MQRGYHLRLGESREMYAIPRTGQYDTTGARCSGASAASTASGAARTARRRVQRQGAIGQSIRHAEQHGIRGPAPATATAIPAHVEAGRPSTTWASRAANGQVADDRAINHHEPRAGQSPATRLTAPSA